MICKKMHITIDVFLRFKIWTHYGQTLHEMQESTL